MPTELDNHLSDFIDRKNVSTIAILPFLPTAPNRGRIPWSRHQGLNVSQKNWRPLSVITCFGLEPVLVATRSKNWQTSTDDGASVKSANPFTRREN